MLDERRGARWQTIARDRATPEQTGEASVVSHSEERTGDGLTTSRREGTRVGWVPQRPAHYGRLSARENIELFARLEGEADPARAAERLLTAFELPGDGRASGSLSVGNRQRLNLAIALLGDPHVLLLDEPTASLDPGQRRRLWDRVDALRERGGAIVFATQNVDELERHADRVVALRDGSVVFDGSVADYEREPAIDLFA